jgi:two-component system response regulator FixJ
MCELLIIDVNGQASQRLELLTRFHGLYPYLPVIVLVGCGDTSLAVAAMKAGAADCLEKPLGADRLLDAVTAALGSGQPSGRQVHRALTRMENRVLHLLLAGKTNLEVAEQFHRSRRTIEVHRMNIMRKLDVSSVVDLVREALRIGLIGKSEPRNG